MVRVLICDDQAIVRESLAAILDSDPEIQVVGVVGDGAEALARVAATTLDVVLMDLEMPGMNGVQATREIVRLHSAKVLVLTTYGDEALVIEAIESGAAGYLLKGTPRAQLVAAIKGTAAGGTHVDPAVAGVLFDRVTQRQAAPSPAIELAEALSARELDVLRLVARGLTNTEIADRLALSYGTVRNYVSVLLAKLGVADRTQAALLALRHGLVELDDL